MFLDRRAGRLGPSHLLHYCYERVCANSQNAVSEERGEPIARMLKELREQNHHIPVSPEDPDDIIIPEFEKIKTEVYALTAFVIERIHADAERSIREGTMAIIPVRRFPLNEFTDDRVDVESMETASPRDFFSKTWGFQELYPTAFALGLTKWRNDALREPGSYDARVRNRFMDLLQETVMGTRARAKDDAYLPEAFVMRGAETAASTSWGILRAIPVAYFNKFGRTITPEEYEVLAESSESLVVLLSSLHISSLTKLIDFAKAGSRVHKAMGLEFPLELFSIEEEEGKLTLVFDKSAIEAYARFRGERYSYDSSEEKRLGCPARDARITDARGKQESIVSAIHHLHLDLARQYLLPRLEDYIEGALEVATEPPEPLDLIEEIVDDLVQ